MASLIQDLLSLSLRFQVQEAGQTLKVMVRIRRKGGTAGDPGTQEAVLERGSIERLDKSPFRAGRHLDGRRDAVQINPSDLLSAKPARSAEKVQYLTLGGARRQRFDVEQWHEGQP